MFSFLQNKRLTAEEKFLVGKVKKTEQQVELGQKTVETHRFETNRLDESEETLNIEKNRNLQQTINLQSNLQKNNTRLQEL